MISLPPAKHAAHFASGPASSARFGRRRAWVLALVHVAMAAHYAHWRLAGRTLAPLELNEAVFTAAEGVITAGFVLLVVLTLASAVVGRFFCSWGCHLLALQDLAAWAFERLGIHPRPLRSRMLAALPFAAMLYMFAWPLLYRAANGIEAQPHFREAGAAWSSFVTDDFTRNLPGWPVALTTFAVCGFFVVYLMGSRSFCSHVCPYGALFGLADRLAPGRITARGDCSDCGACTAVCQSHVRVHQELARFGTVVDSACLRDLDCVAACPDGRVRFGFTTPPLLRRLERGGALARKWDTSWREEALVLTVASLAFFALRGLFGAFPFLLTLTLAVLLGFAALLSLRVLAGKRVRVHKLHLRDERGLAPVGAVWLGATSLALALVVQSGAVRALELHAASQLQKAERSRSDPTAAAKHARAAHAQWLRVQRFSLDPPTNLVERLARSAELSGDRTRALELLQAAPERLEFRLEAARLLAEDGKLEPAREALERIVERWPESALAHYQLGVLRAASGGTQGAIESFRRSAALAPDDADAHNNLGFLLLQADRASEAEPHLQRAVQLAPSHAAARFNWGVLLARQARTTEARGHLEAARALDRRYAPAVDELLRELR